ncbi:ExbD/TolR family protein [Cerasicoccus fimbriatus]|uniref:ExbD/TolR family protein n=1 Tax=Cerasicoccus fimbriatus TaxID=3014554 RepID=UPI0022B3B6A7|nr:biopolymer transporter ExbD [Cerasicoccus sp. TK19100]
MIIRRKSRIGAEVPLSPLIDCVFLLLIFFLVTTMLKKTEKQVPILMPEADLALADESGDNVLIIGVDLEGNPYLGRRGTRMSQMIDFTPIDNLSGYLQSLAEAQSSDIPIQLAVDRMTETQEVISILDVFQIQGFQNVYVSTRENDQADTSK